MNYQSICPYMNQDAKKLPSDQNLILYFRHSIRFDNPVDGNYDPIMLTPEGIALANQIGASLDLPLGHFSSSPIGRCKQTIEEIARGAGMKHPDIHTNEAFVAMKGYDHATLLGTTWYEYFYSLQRGDTKKTGGVTLEQEAKPILDALFQTPQTLGALNLICSHDSHIVILASALFGLKTSLEHDDSWCKFTEGLFFYGTRQHFTALWRGEEKTFDHFLSAT